jgi:hypothetical protein
MYGRRGTAPVGNDCLGIGAREPSEGGMKNSRESD